VIARANATEFGLSAGVFTPISTRAHRVVGRCRPAPAGSTTYNLTPIEMPFGGVKASGIGRENARAAIEAYSQSQDGLCRADPGRCALLRYHRFSLWITRKLGRPR
jgi:acyl-CoA reductase-like NAD-dependent aldehyde dehydrogenase